ncbi:hypothetical protein ANCCEY_10483 [Ancylostoma ceylanicum]|uniref:DNA2/NAM7 helicase-like C-terminal domain-containing protein n=1 Tax=Ancylostoma ceylanicum TaxID=53326 RepID=A0A0D6LER3_9BILA|nr:hypothetical protein ANCCEY_10483 [Ancylostoma ceylanicum]
MIDTLQTAKAVSIVPLVTTFRTHPPLNTLPNSFIYDGTQVDEIRVADRQLLAGTSVKSAGHSHDNPAEAAICQALVRRLPECDVESHSSSSTSIALITFYKEEQKRNSRKNMASTSQPWTPYKDESAT